jgi:outer membrane protein OmpA-like peptidoglycan-associated protein
MTSLAVIFILLLVASLNNMSVKSGSTRGNIVGELREKLNNFIKEGVSVEPDPSDPLSLLVLIPEGLLQFEVMKADVPEKGQLFLQQFTPRLVQTLCSNDYRAEIDSVIIEGHSDSSGDERINLPLSQERSMKVARLSLEVIERADYGLGPEERIALKQCFLNQLSASGRGSASPINDANGVEDMGRSRRVVYRIRVRSIEQRDQFEKGLMLGTPPAVR